MRGTYVKNGEVTEVYIGNGITQIFPEKKEIDAFTFLPRGQKQKKNKSGFKMTRKKWITYIKILLGILACFGFILIVGAIGQADYTAEIHEAYTAGQMIRQIAWGCVAIAPTAIWIAIANWGWLD